MSTTIALPRVLRIGRGCSAELGEVLAAAGLSRPLVVTDEFVAAQPFMVGVMAGLDKGGLKYEVYMGVRPDPTTESVGDAVAVLRRGDFDCVVGIGGGSSIDTAKAVALLGSLGGSMRDYKAPVVTDTSAMPVIAVPTTAGSGSECTRYTIITDSATDEKMLCAGLAFLPSIALVDPEPTMTMPRRLTADTGVDALVHAIEAYVSRRANPFTDDLALTAMRTLFGNLRKVYADPGDSAARAAMMLGATQAGMAFSNSSVALVHGMSRPIGAHFHIAHGLSNAMLMPTVTEYSVSAAPGRYAACARAVGVADEGVDEEVAGRALVDALKALNYELEVPGPREYGIPELAWRDRIPVMARQAVASGSPGNNPRVPSADEIEGIYHSLWR